MADRIPQVCGTCYWWGELSFNKVLGLARVCNFIGGEGDGRQYLEQDDRPTTPEDPYCQLISTRHYTCNGWETK